ncbi:TVP38/TMEM64 family protein [Legionella genomosp. 1]|uniref:TVP38/TMEM64 family protein n=1 Tax=Legionella genomosp. 1 TaxID=1093625 RepID=UPI0021CB2310|nr:TVP38/TMEM64 family protein [Legionella genomosp. 1]
MDLNKNNTQKQLMWTQLKRWLPLLIIFLVLVLIFSTGLQKYLSFESLKTRRFILLEWTTTHFLLSSLLFVVIYTVAVAVSIPGATFLTLAGGFLFGPVFGSILVIISATVGATLLYFAVKTSLGDWLAQKATGWISRMREGFQENAFSYLLFLRLVPLFPFWVINIVPALLGVSATTFIVATFFGIMPGSVVYVLVGNGLSHIFATNQTPNLSIIFDPKVFYPLLALAALSLLPVIYQKFFKRTKGT